MEFPETDLPPEQPVEQSEQPSLPEELLPEDLLPEEPVVAVAMEDTQLKAVLEAIVYVTEQPLSLDQICAAIEQSRERVIDLLEQLAADYEKPDRGWLPNRSITKPSAVS